MNRYKIIVNGIYPDGEPGRKVVIILADNLDEAKAKVREQITKEGIKVEDLYAVDGDNNRIG